MTITVFLLFILGLIFISYGANALVASTENISKKYNISYFLSSFVFIGLATSSPEIFISIISSLDGKSNLAIGNALGSNVANIAFVFAISYLFLNKDILHTNKIIDRETYGFILILVIITMIVFLILKDGMVSINDALLLISAFFILVFLYKKFFYQKLNDHNNLNLTDEKNGSVIIINLIIGLLTLLIGTELLLNSSITVAKYYGVSDYVIGLSITAVGSSIPELASSIESARKKNLDFIIGNILGSNIFNFAIVISLAGLFSSELPKSLHITDLLRDMTMILITMVSFYIIIKNRNYLFSKILCTLLLGLFTMYQISLYGVDL
jgi:cation:H+ antiporter